MTINLSVPATHELKPRLTVIGVGGAGGNAVNNMITAHLEGVDFVVTNTDAQSLAQSLTERRIQLGASATQGLGAGSQPDIGRAAAEEAMDAILDHLEGANMVFVTAGMGGGTGTGAAPVIARMAREQGILAVGVVTKPFHFEGKQRMRIAEAGIAELQECVDTLIIIPNQNLFRVANETTTLTDAFKMADDVLHSGVRGVTDLMMMPGLINLDFADVRSVMNEMGKAMMGTGEAEGERRALDAAEAAVNNPLLDDVSLNGARGVLVNITGGPDMTLYEVDEACNHIRDQVDGDANIIFGSTFDEQLAGRIRISVVATGIDADAANGAEARGARPVAVGQTVPFTAVASAKPAPTAEPAPRLFGRAPATEARSAGAAEPGKETAPGRPGTEATARPAGETRGRAQDAFIPPPPADPERPIGRVAGPAVLAEADLVNASRAGGDVERPAPAAKPSLIERMARGARRRSPTVPQPAKPEPVLETVAAAPAPPLLDARTTDEDLLEIPAFLRRQSN